MSEAANVPSVEVVLQLRDGTQGHLLKTWTFVGKSSISIGRADACDVEVVEAYVSREHAILERREKWVLISRGRNGVFVNDQPIREHTIDGDVTFRLGPAGHLLAFSTRSAIQESTNMATVCPETLPVMVFSLDEQRIEEEVGVISGGDVFRQLQIQARALRKKRGGV